MVPLTTRMEITQILRECSKYSSKVGIKYTNPKYAITKGTVGAAAYDLKARLDQPITLAPGKRALILTGTFIELPENFYALVLPRSGNALKKGLTVLNTPGLLDSDWRGENGVILINLGEEDQVIKDGDKIAQLLIQQGSRVKLVEIEELSQTQRGAGGFGSTDKI